MLRRANWKLLQGFRAERRVIVRVAAATSGLVIALAAAALGAALQAPSPGADGKPGSRRR
jgi:hypothetical protein